MAPERADSDPQSTYWPVPTRLLADAGDDSVRALLGLAAEQQADLARDVAMSSIGILNEFMALLELSLLVQSEMDGELELGFEAPALSALRGIRGSMSDADFGSALPQPRIRWSYLRGVARMRSWTPWHRMPAGILMPQAVGLSHNALLRHCARSQKMRLGFRNAQSYLLDARAAADAGDAGEMPGNLAVALTDALLSARRELRPPVREQLHRILLGRCRTATARAARDARALRRLSGLPKHAWSGSTAAYATRVVGREIRRRGGTLTSFDHGGVTAISQLSSNTALGELAIATRFVVGTETWADLLRTNEAMRLVAPLNTIEIAGADGEPTFRQACRDRPPPQGRKPNVLYVIHPFRGYRQYIVADPPDSVYWQFQRHVALLLLDLPIHLVCKPHPEGFLLGQRTPIERIATTSYRRFEEHLSDTDVFVFDAPTSTTFAEALCTNRPIVLLDRGHHRLNPAIRDRIAERCRIVPTQTDEWHRITVDSELLRAAVTSTAAPVDPSYFRHLLAGL